MNQRNRVKDTVRVRLDRIPAEITILQARLAEVQAEIDRLTTKKSTIESNIAELNAETVDLDAFVKAP